MKIYPIFNRGWLIEFSEGRTVVLSDEEYEKLAVETSHILALGVPVASGTGVSIPLNDGAGLLHLCFSDEAEIFAEAVTQGREGSDSMTIKKHLEYFLAYRAYRRGWEAGYRRGLEDGSVALPTKSASDNSWLQTEKSTRSKA